MDDIYKMGLLYESMEERNKMFGANEYGESPFSFQTDREMSRKMQYATPKEEKRLRDLRDRIAHYGSLLGHAEAILDRVYRSQQRKGGDAEFLGSQAIKKVRELENRQQRLKFDIKVAQNEIESISDELELREIEAEEKSQNLSDFQDPEDEYDNDGFENARYYYDDDYDDVDDELPIKDTEEMDSYINDFDDAESYTNPDYMYDREDEDEQLSGLYDDSGYKASSSETSNPRDIEIDPAMRDIANTLIAKISDAIGPDEEDISYALNTLAEYLTLHAAGQSNPDERSYADVIGAR